MPFDIDVRAARVALAEALATIPKLNTHAYYPGVINAPAAVVLRRENRYSPAVDIGADVTLAVRLYLSIGNPTGNQAALDDYLAPSGPQSLRAVIEADPTLGGTVDFAIATTAEAEGLVEANGKTYISADLIVEVG